MYVACRVQRKENLSWKTKSWTTRFASSLWLEKKEIDLSVNRPEILDKLTQKKFRRIPENNSEGVISDFHYLLSMSLESLCYETLEELKAEKMVVQEKFEELRKLDSKSLWLEDLNALERQFHVCIVTNRISMSVLITFVSYL